MSDATEADFHAAFEAEVDAALTYAPTTENVREHMAAWLAKHVRLEVEVEELGPGKLVAHAVITFARPCHEPR